VLVGRLPAFEGYHLSCDELARAFLKRAQLIGNVEIHVGASLV
jgi:hypothetical protein